MDALRFLDKVAKAKRQPLVVLSGEEEFLKRLCRDAVIAEALGDADPSLAVSTYSGEKLDFGSVRNELETMPFIGPVRVVIVETADPFVTAYRESLETYAANPSKVGILILNVKSFPETTKLAKALPDAAKVACKAPTETQLIDWCQKWCPSRYAKAMTFDAAHLLLERVGSQMGLLDQEMAKLATVAKTEISAEDVDQFVARTREANVFRILDLIGEGKSAEALAVVAELLDDGEDVYMILGAMTSQLRKLAAVNRIVASGQPLGSAMDAAGVPRWPQMRQGVERQLRHLGRRRLHQLTDWLVQVNMGLRGDNLLPPRLQLERFLVKLARPRIG